MKPTSPLIRATLDSGPLMDRGGRPTLRELLAGLQFDARTATLRLNGERVALHLSEADRILRRELIQRLGMDEARIFLMRRGFRMGQHDAAFVAASWPALDRGDAFTAGTRLHMFSGIVRVETAHNDFDFARGRFSAEFLWHNSIEAEDAKGVSGPACWQQVGYASGYASFFFGALVVYKEIACAAQGHPCCRVVGKLAEGWGEDDPEVILFRTRIVPATPPVSDPLPVPEHAMPDLLMPLRGQLDRAASLPLPCLIAGRGNVGQQAALEYLASRIGAEALHLRAESCDPAALDGRRLVVLDGIEALPPAAQTGLARRLADPGPRILLSSALPLATLAGHLVPALWMRLMPLAIEMPAPDPGRIAGLRLAEIARRLGLAVPPLSPEAAEALPADLDAMDAVLTGALVEVAAGADITRAQILAARARLAPPPGESAFEVWLVNELAAGDFSLEAHEARIRAAAMAQSGGNLSAAARLLGLSRAQLAYREKVAAQADVEGGGAGQ